MAHFRWKRLAVLAFTLACAGGALFFGRFLDALEAPPAAPFLREGSGTGKLVIGTFNIENFDLRRKTRAATTVAYTDADAAELAQTIRASGAHVLALQEIQGDETMREFVTRFLPGWAFCGNDTGGTQDLYFLWNTSKVRFLEPPLLKFLRLILFHRAPMTVSYFANRSYDWNGQRARLFDRSPLAGDFQDLATGKTFTLVSVHLKSQLIIAAEDRDEARRRNTARRNEQIAALDLMAQSRSPGDPPLFILGDYNADFIAPKSADDVTHPPRYPLLALQNGYSYDKKNMRGNLDYIGYTGIARSRLRGPFETETRIERRSTPNVEHPDHDIITVEVDLS